MGHHSSRDPRTQRRVQHLLAHLHRRVRDPGHAGRHLVRGLAREPQVSADRQGRARRPRCSEARLQSQQPRSDEALPGELAVGSLAPFKKLQICCTKSWENLLICCRQVFKHAKRWKCRFENVSLK